MYRAVSSFDAPRPVSHTAYIHSIYFTLDLHGGNIAFTLPELHAWTIEDVYKRLGDPEILQTCRLDNQPLGLEAPSYRRASVSMAATPRGRYAGDSMY